MSESTSKMSRAMTGLSSRLSSLKPFRRSSAKNGNDADDEEDVGFEVDETTLAGGGHAGRATELIKHKLHVSDALRAFLVRESVLSEADAALVDESASGGDEKGLSPALHALVEAPHAEVPPEVLDRSHKLPAYFISSSHNTYLLAHQLYGDSSAEAYRTALRTGTRCVEIDAWDDEANPDEPKVTHGYTLVSNVPFREVCKTIIEVAQQEEAEAKAAGSGMPGPIIISLENHCSAHGQLRLVQIMKEVFGDKLLSGPVTNTEGPMDPADHVRLADLGSKICLMVEFHLPNEPESSESDTSSSESEDEEEKQARKQYEERKKAAKQAKAPSKIIPELAEMGVYAQSVKPLDSSWYSSPGGLTNAPHHQLINVSETGLAKELASNPEARDQIIAHNARHLMRVYPKGTRISSQNLKPIRFWGVGAQICGLNWQTFGASMQINEAMFSGTDGYVLKPAALRQIDPQAAAADAEATKDKKKRLRLRIAGATDVPPGDSTKGTIKPYVSCILVQPLPALPGSPNKAKTKPYSPSSISAAAGAVAAALVSSRSAPPPPSPPTDPVWDETLEWTYSATQGNDELAFVRILVKSDDAWAENPILCVGAVRVLYAVKNEWRFIRLLDLRGHETRCSLLVKWEVEDA